MAQATISRAYRARDHEEPLRAESPLPVLLRSCGFTYLGTFIGGYAVCAVLVSVVTATAGGAPFSLGTALAGALGLWLTANHVPLTIDGADLGVLPIALPLLLVWFVAHAAGGVARRNDVHTPAAGGVLCAAMAFAQAVVGTVIAACLGIAAPVTAFLACAVLAGLAALLGVAKPSGMLESAREKLGDTAVAGIRLGFGAVALLFAAATLTLTIAVLTTVSSGATLFARGAPGIGAGVGMLLLCAGYLPNAVVAALSFVAGPGFSIGQFSVTPLSFHGGTAPPVPLLAALPGGSGAWWPVFLLAPLAAGVAIGWYSRSLDEDATQRLRIVAIAGLVAAFSWLVLAALAGGSLGGGAVNPVLIPAGALALAVFGWIAVVGGVVTWFAAPGRTAVPALDADADAASQDEQAESTADSEEDIVDDEESQMNAEEPGR